MFGLMQFKCLRKIQNSTFKFYHSCIADYINSRWNNGLYFGDTILTLWFKTWHSFSNNLVAFSMNCLPPTKIAPNPKTNLKPNPNPNLEAIFLGSNCLVVPLTLKLTLVLTQTAALIRGQFSFGAIVQIPIDRCFS